MLTAYLITALLAAGAVWISRRRFWTDLVTGVFCVVQAAVAAMACMGRAGGVGYFAVDRVGGVFFALLAIVSPAVMAASRRYLDTERQWEYNLYNMLLVLLCVSVAGTCLADNIAVTWIMLEVTTLCAAGLVYHRRTPRALEAAWKYVFVCSTGIALAYLGIMFIGATAGGDLSYSALAWSVAAANPLYLKVAFLFILVGYSSKMEVFPLYNAGVDANYAAPAPASALISTSLAGAGFVAFYRVGALMGAAPVAVWTRNVMVLTGLCSLLVGVLFMRRTNNYKRLLSYSTVENMGIALVGLGLGGAAAVAAVVHVAGHALVKSSLFIQLARLGKSYGTYRINRIGGCMAADGPAAVGMFGGASMLIALPPSPLFVSELVIMWQALSTGRWWVAAAMLVPVCIAIHTVASRMLRLGYGPVRAEPVRGWGGTALWPAVSLLLVAAAAGVALLNVLSRIAL